MLVLGADKLGRRPAQAIHALPSEQRFAITVVAAFAAALVLLGVLFAMSGEPTTNGQNRPLSGLMAQDTRPTVAPTPAASNA